MTGRLSFGDRADRKTNLILPEMHLKKEEKYLFLFFETAIN
jgi:hypothetical protein